MGENDTDQKNLSLIQEHYLKRELLKFQIDYEVEKLNDFKNLGLFGPPFKLHDDDSAEKQRNSDGIYEYPILRYMLCNCVQTFPFISQADDKLFWQDKVQSFVEKFAEKDISSTADRTEETKRRRIGAKLKKLILLYTASGLQTTRDEKNAKLEMISERGLVENKRGEDEVNQQRFLALNEGQFVNGFDLNVVGVRKVSIRRGFLYDEDTEYIIRAQFEGGPSVFTARKYEDFQQLSKMLLKAFPGKKLPSLPSKNKRSSSAALEEDGDDKSIRTEDSDSESIKKPKIPLPFRKLKANSTGGTKLYREKQRVTLRGYLKSLQKISQVSRNQTFLEFLFKDRIRELSKAELYDIELRKKMDLMRIEYQIKFLQIATSRARKLESHIIEIKEELTKKDGFKSFFRELRDKNSINDLSPKFQKFIEWIIIELAATLYSMFVAGDNSPEFYSQIRRIHGIMPYSVLKGIMRWSNPVAMMKGVMDLFLVQPFGKKSLFQNILLIVLADDIKAQTAILDELKIKMGNNEIVHVLEEFSKCDWATRQEIRKRAETNNVDLVVSIFSSPDILNCIISSQLQQDILLWYSEWNRAVEEESSNDINTKYVDMFSQIQEYLKLEIRRRDKDMMQEFWADSVTVQFLRQVITIFYGPLIKVFKSANMYQAIGDFERFMSDAIKVIDEAESSISVTDPNQLVESFIQLCRRHQDDLYRFIHDIYLNDDGLFDGLIEWINNMIEFLRQGAKDKLDLYKIFELAKYDPNIDCEAILKEMDSIIQWIVDRRKWRDDKLAKRNKKKQGEKKSELEWEAAMPSTNVIEGKDFGMNNEDLEDFEDEDEDDVNDDGEEENSDSEDISGLSPVERERKRREKLVQKLESETSSGPRRPEIIETKKLRSLLHQELVNILI